MAPLPLPTPLRPLQSRRDRHHDTGCSADSASAVTATTTKSALSPAPHYRTRKNGRHRHHRRESACPRGATKTAIAAPPPPLRKPPLARCRPYTSRHSHRRVTAATPPLTHTSCHRGRRCLPPCRCLPTRTAAITGRLRVAVAPAIAKEPAATSRHVAAIASMPPPPPPELNPPYRRRRRCRQGLIAAEAHILKRHAPSYTNSAPPRPPRRHRTITAVASLGRPFCTVRWRKVTLGAAVLRPRRTGGRCSRRRPRRRPRRRSVPR